MAPTVPIPSAANFLVECCSAVACPYVGPAKQQRIPPGPINIEPASRANTVSGVLRGVPNPPIDRPVGIGKRANLAPKKIFQILLAALQFVAQPAIVEGRQVRVT